MMGSRAARDSASSSFRGHRARKPRAAARATWRPGLRAERAAGQFPGPIFYMVAEERLRRVASGDGAG